MATITIADQENRRIEDAEAIRAFLEPFGINYEQWDVAGRIGDQASDEEILEAYAPEVARLKAAGGFVTADVINVNPETPGLDAMLEKFSKEHTHSEDEVRFTVRGQGVFHIHARARDSHDAAVFAVHVESGDLINVPAGTRHWFDLCEDRQIRCIRLFEDQSGWTPHYVENGVEGNYAPMCWGPDYLPPASDSDPVVKL